MIQATARVKGRMRSSRAVGAAVTASSVTNRLLIVSGYNFIIVDRPSLRWRIRYLYLCLYPIRVQVSIYENHSLGGGHIIYLDQRNTGGLDSVF
jgi:hypothetical protein